MEEILITPDRPLRRSLRLTIEEGCTEYPSQRSALLEWRRHGLPTMPPNGCFAAGTSILLADGSHKPIERISFYRNKEQTGDRITTLGGSYAWVVDLVHGEETLPLVFLTIIAYDLSGHKQELTVGLTEKHPVLVRYNYLVQANWLDQGDLVHTRYGPGTIVDVKRKVVKEEVWNLVMTGPDFLSNEGYGDESLRFAYASTSLLGLKPREHIIFANGIALATWPLQTQLAAALKNGINLNTFN